MIERTELTNGIRIVSERMDGAPSVSLGIWVENGSRFEERRQAGISHFLEHLLFKGTERRNAAQIAEEIDAVGGVLNAFTGKEATCYYARVLAEDFPLAADVLSDIFLHSRFDPEEIERERGVVLQEISQAEDTPDDFIHDFFSLNYWPEHPLGYPICGNSESVRSFQRDDFTEFVAERYRPDRIVIAAAGQIDHDTLHRWADSCFGALDGTTVAVETPLPRPQPGFFRVEKPLEQVHLCLGTPGVAQISEQRFAAYILNTVLGGGMSSRLFQEIRERQGRAYSVYSFLSSYCDAGYLGVYVGTSAEWANGVLRSILAEFGDLRRVGMGDDELCRAKSQLKGNMLLGLETSDSRMNRLARNEIYFRRHFSLAEVAERIDATTNEDLIALARQILRPESMAVAFLGDAKGYELSDGVLDFDLSQVGESA